jgi:hypothetical protein
MPSATHDPITMRHGLGRSVALWGVGVVSVGEWACGWGSSLRGIGGGLVWVGV